MWFPAVHQMRFARNESWINSAWLGVFWPIVLFPSLFFYNFIVPVVGAVRHGFPLWRILWLRSRATMTMHIKFIILGITGNVSTEDVTMEELNRRFAALG